MRQWHQKHHSLDAAACSCRSAARSPGRLKKLALFARYTAEVMESWSVELVVEELAKLLAERNTQEQQARYAKEDDVEAVWPGRSQHTTCSRWTYTSNYG